MEIKGHRQLRKNGKQTGHSLTLNGPRVDQGWTRGGPKAMLWSAEKHVRMSVTVETKIRRALVTQWSEMVSYLDRPGTKGLDSATPITSKHL